MSAKYLSDFLNMITPIIVKTITKASDIPRSSQFTGSVPRRDPLAALMTPVIGLIANIHEYFPAMLDGYITGVTKSNSWMKKGRA